MKKITNHQGLSLVEVLVTVLILTMLVGVVYAGFSAGSMSWQTYQSNIVAQQQVRKVLETIKRDLREGSGISITQSASSVTLSFSKTNGDSITYTWTNTGNQATRVIRQINGTSTVMANYITGFSLTNNTTSITVDITATKTSPGGHAGALNLKEKIALRS